MKILIYCFSLLFFIHGELSSQTFSLFKKIQNADGKLLSGVHAFDFRLTDSKGVVYSQWQQHKLVLLSDGNFAIELGDIHQGASGVIPAELFSTHTLEILENGRVLDRLPLTNADNYNTLKSNSLAGAKVLLSDLEQGEATSGQILTWTSADGWRPKTVPSGIASSGVNTVNSIKGDLIVEAKAPLKVTATSGKLTFEIENSQPTYDVPIGSIIAYFGLSSSVPDGWLLCDGQSGVGDTYPQLRDRLKDLGFVGDKTPDLRGQFLRGANLSRDSVSGDPDWKNRIGIGEKIGSVQGDMFKNHNHSASATGSPAGNYGFADGGGARNVCISTTTPSISFSGGNETRVKNVAVNYIIKAK